MDFTERLNNMTKEATKDISNQKVKIDYKFRKDDYVMAECYDTFNDTDSFNEMLQKVYVECCGKGVPILLYTNYGCVKCERVPDRFVEFRNFCISKMIWFSTREIYDIELKRPNKAKLDSTKKELDFLKQCYKDSVEVSLMLDDCEVLFKTDSLISFEKLLILCASKVKHIFKDGVHTLHVYMAGHNDAKYEFINLESFMNALTDIIHFCIFKDDKLIAEIIDNEIPERIKDLFK